jgi:hypothetical protein
VELEFLDGNSPEQCRIWDELVNRAPVPDVYYRPGYVRAYAFEGWPTALVIRHGVWQLLFPLLMRTLEARGGAVADAITPYGYGGVLPVAVPGGGPAQPDAGAVYEILCRLREWAAASGLAACAIRFHPLLSQEQVWRSAPAPWLHFASRGQTTALDPSQWNPAGECLAGMSKGRRYDLKRARGVLTTRFSYGPDPAEALDIFGALYPGSMERAQAAPFFFFGPQYFACLARELGEKFAIVTARAEERPVASAIFLADRDFAHYHLACSNDEGRKWGAATLLIMAAFAWQRERGYRLLHLGGGLHAGDSLWAFKRSFGGALFRYSYLTIVADETKYDRLHGDPAAPWPYAQLSN